MKLIRLIFKLVSLFISLFIAVIFFSRMKTTFNIASNIYDDGIRVVNSVAHTAGEAKENISSFLGGLLDQSKDYLPGLTKAEDYVKNEADRVMNHAKTMLDRQTAVKTTAHIKTPTKELASSVLTPTVVKELGNLRYQDGSYVINNNRTNLNAKVSSKPYVDLKTKSLNGQELPTVANALLKRSSRQYQHRNETGNGAASWTPVGWHQMTISGGAYPYAVNRGHSIAYALAGSIKGFDASESNPKNITTQTSWANQARDTDSRGQNYYEGLVRKALDQNKTVRYRVTCIYADEGDLVPIGNHLEAKSSDNSLEFNVFIPNVQNGIAINYATGEVTVK